MEEELNVFLHSHRVLGVERKLVEEGGQSFWCFCVDYLEQVPVASTGRQWNNGSGVPRNRVDYQAELSPEQFRVYLKLREWRKEVEARDGVPVYTIFTNEQLARMVRQPTLTHSDLSKVEGVGEGRVEKYGEGVLAALARAGVGSDEASEPPVSGDPGAGQPATRLLEGSKGETTSSRGEGIRSKPGLSPRSAAASGRDRQNRP